MSPGIRFLLPVLAIACSAPAVHAEEAPSAFIIGADISWVQQQEEDGIRWIDGGAQKDIFAIPYPP